MSQALFFMHRLVVLFVLSTLWPVCVSAQTVPVAPGEYITEAGWGVLTLVKTQQQAFHFTIDSVGGNAHICSLEGDIQNQRAVLKADEADKPCVLKFLPTETGIDVSSVDSESCRFYCGARAYFEGLYLRPPLACTEKERENTRKQFTRLYASKAYEKAYKTLEPLLSQCEKTLDWLDVGRIRNDLAVTQFHLGLLAECRKTLEPLNASLAATGEKLPKTEAELKAILPPSDFESYLPIAKATWHNGKLCQQ